jgi:hypothetical protein
VGAALAVPLAAVGSDGPAVVTILEGSAVVFRGISKLGASEGVRIQPNDLVETGKDTFLRLEFGDGTRLDLGSVTRLQVNHPTETSADRPALYVLSGGFNPSFDDAKRTRAPAFATPLFYRTDLSGVVLARVDPNGGAMFVDQGRARVACMHRSRRRTWARRGRCRRRVLHRSNRFTDRSRSRRDPAIRAAMTKETGL